MRPGKVLWRSMAWKLRFPWRWWDVSARCRPWSFSIRNPKDGRQNNGGKDGNTDPPSEMWADGIHVLLDWPDENEYMCMWSISHVVPTTSCWRLIGLQSPLQAVHNERVQPGRTQLYSWPKVVLSQLLFDLRRWRWKSFFCQTKFCRFEADPLEFPRQISWTNGKPGDTRTDGTSDIQELREELQSERPPGGTWEFVWQISSLGRGYPPGHQKERKGKDFRFSNFHHVVRGEFLNKLRGSFRVVNFTSRLAEVSIWQKQSEAGGNCKSCGNLEIWDSDVKEDTIFENMYSGLFMDHLVKIPSSF